MLSLIHISGYLRADALAPLYTQPCEQDQEKLRAAIAQAAKRYLGTPYRLSLIHIWVPMFSRSHLFVKGDRIASFTPHWAGYHDTQYINVTLK